MIHGAREWARKTCRQLLKKVSLRWVHLQIFINVVDSSTTHFYSVCCPIFGDCLWLNCFEHLVVLWDDPLDFVKRTCRSRDLSKPSILLMILEGIKLLGWWLLVARVVPAVWFVSVLLQVLQWFSFYFRNFAESWRALPVNNFSIFDLHFMLSIPVCSIKFSFDSLGIRFSLTLYLIFLLFSHLRLRLLFNMRNIWDCLELNSLSATRVRNHCHARHLTQSCNFRYCSRIWLLIWSFSARSLNLLSLFSRKLLSLDLLRDIFMIGQSGTRKISRFNGLIF